MSRAGLAILVLGVAVVAAFAVHSYRVTSPASRGACLASQTAPVDLFAKCSAKRRPGWVDPVALGVIVLGLAGAASLGRHRSTA